MSETYRAKMLVSRTEIKLEGIMGVELELVRHGAIVAGVQLLDRVTVLCESLTVAPRVGEWLEVVIHDSE